MNMNDKLAWEISSIGNTNTSDLYQVLEIVDIFTSWQPITSLFKLSRWYQYQRSPPFIWLDDYHRNSDQRNIRFQTIFWRFSMASIKGVGAFVIRRNDL